MSVATERYASDNLQLLWIDFVTAPANRKHKRLTCQWEQSQTGLFEPSVSNPPNQDCTQLAT